MKKINTLVLIFATMLFVACSKDDDAPQRVEITDLSVEGMVSGDFKPDLKVYQENDLVVFSFNRFLENSFPFSSINAYYLLKGDQLVMYVTDTADEPDCETGDCLRIFKVNLRTPVLPKGTYNVVVYINNGLIEGMTTQYTQK